MIFFYMSFGFGSEGLFFWMYFHRSRHWRGGYVYHGSSIKSIVIENLPPFYLFILYSNLKIELRLHASNTKVVFYPMEVWPILYTDHHHIRPPSSNVPRKSTCIQLHTHTPPRLITSFLPSHPFPCLSHNHHCLLLPLLLPPPPHHLPLGAHMREDVEY